MPAPAAATPKAPLVFPGWPAALAADDSLAPGLRESYRWVISQFLQFCAPRQTGVSVAGAREFVELKRLELSPSPARLREWQEGLNWFFRRGRGWRRGC